jgi:predicted PurR-regulated permease PerM/methylmalonyl-CoA mutase cobalamin-binding subunit
MFMAKQRGSSPLFALVAIIAVVSALYLAKEILLPLALAILLSFLLTPLANRLERWRMPRVLAVILVVAASFVPLGIVGGIVTNQLVALSDSLPRYRQSIVNNVAAKVRSIRPSSDTLNTVSKTVEDLGQKLADGDSVEADDVADAANQEPENASTQEGAAAGDESDGNDGEDVNKAVPVEVINRPSLLDQVGTWLSQLAAPLTTAGLVVVLVFFLLLDRESQRNRLIQLFGRSNLRLTTEAFHDAAGRVGRYLRMLFLINLSYGIAVAAGLWLIGLPSAIMWGVLGFTLRFLPYIGPWISALGPILVSVAVTEGWTQPLLVMGMYVVYELFLNNVAEPLLYGSSVGVSSVGVILSAIFWTWLWGPIGLVLAMPMTVCLLVTAHYIPQLRFLKVILADQPPLTPPERIYQRLLAFDYNEPLKVARTHLKTSTLASFYDDVLIPALVLAEQDRHAGLLNEDQEDFVQEGAGDLVAELRDAASVVDEPDAEASTIRAPTSDGPLTTDAEKARVLCIPLRDEADETAAQMLAQLLAAEGFAVETEAAASLTSELVDRVETTASDVVVISILPPISPRDSRLLWKRLRGRYPDLPIIVGFWNSTGAKQSLLPPDNDTVTKVATTLAEAITLVRNAAAQLKSADSDSAQESRTAG